MFVKYEVSHTVLHHTRSFKNKIKLNLGLLDSWNFWKKGYKTLFIYYKILNRDMERPVVLKIKKILQKLCIKLSLFLYFTIFYIKFNMNNFSFGLFLYFMSLKLKVNNYKFLFTFIFVLMYFYFV